MSSRLSRHKDVGSLLANWLGLLALWVVFVGTFDAQEVVAGAVVAALVAFMATGPNPARWQVVLSPRRLFTLVAYLGYLAVAIFRANLQMATIVLSPKLAIRPGIVRVKTRLKSPLGRLVLANSITLTPGTLSVDVDDDDFFIHWINVESEDADEATRRIVSGFERYLEIIFG
ncbi:MAG: Na+/H+ antiporter subunit E [Rhodospirillales bacterium]|jgi:multicomponent Na+:H+ antiporter subunit E|nr:Na+/H+ antiporter subunit E [Rhodospirillales bacterium]